MARRTDQAVTAGAGGAAPGRDRRRAGHATGGTRAGQGWPEGLFRPVHYARSRDRYRPPPDLYRRLSRRLGPAATSWGLAPEDVITVEVPGRRSGVIRRTTMVRAACDGGYYVVSLAGESDWVRNVRAAAGQVVIGGRRRRAARLAEVPVPQRAPVIRAYLLRWGRHPGSRAVAREARYYFGVSPEVPLEEIAGVAEHYPVFRIQYAGGQSAGNLGRIERLSPQDLVNLRVEDRGLPMHVAALIILDGAVGAGAGAADSGRPAPAGLRDPARPASLPDLDTLRVIVAQRLHLVPRLRQVLYRPRPGLGPPVWVDAAGFDIREHVLARPVPAPGDEAALLRVCTELNQDRLDRSRPLWQMWLLTGLADHRAGLLIRLHHVVADGIAALAMLAALCDPDPGMPSAPVPAWAPEPVPSAGELAADQLHRQALAMTGAMRAVRHPAAGAARLGVLARQAGQLARDGAAPRTSLNVPVSGHHRLLLVRADLERARAVAHAHGGTVNDLVLAAVAGGARSVLAARGELTPRLVLRASVAASVRAAPDPRATGNRVGVILVPLPVAEADPARRLAQIAAATADRKRRPPYQPNARLLQRPMVNMMSRQHLVNLLVSNLPGPAAQLRLAGARIREMFQIGIVQGNVTLSVGALSYAGQLTIAVVGDPEAVPDLAGFTAGMAGTLEQLGVG